MKNICLVLVILLFSSVVALAQFKSQAEQPSVAQSLVRPTSINSFFGLLNPNNFMMRHNISLSYMSFGGTGLSVASYTNSMFYKISDPLDVRFDVTLQGSPFGQSNYQNTFSGLYLSRAQLNYKPWENFLIKFEYNHLPLNYYGLSNPWYTPYSYPF
ncbi:MAG: hypothetical protein HY800_03260 [Ignavibacteriales bacterium]|nr:hypothetical protein [Ignavibacteriales bacterium]